ncbi:SpvB/TcaC N-terminal domain-containing protein [Pandoraea sputorum]|uniref:Mono(ADP-ribosyl)transferase SpvB n=1 Tax=Pandoraea sputorum TaxID=93222 RepID=A0A5E5AWV6_9BURK|nr:SpvB/TcaC N-terminal domain-containing protein [Pandoraea sputorum]VVE77438.1 Mono(ADP-ribosyl)transferase SpvB [Pandoraea sputorum]
MTSTSIDTPVAAPTLPKGGGAIQSLGKGWGAVGTTGAASLAIALPITGGRGFAPALSLDYTSQGGKTAFGQGWQSGTPCIARRTNKGVPAYLDTDELVAPNGDVMVPETDASGAPVTRTMTSFRGAPLARIYTVTRYFPRVLGTNRIESWRADDEWFWLMHDGDGSVHVFGKIARTEALGDDDGDDDAPHIGQWWLDESVAPNGECIRYRYAIDAGWEGEADAARGPDVAPSVYLQRATYGNRTALLAPNTLTHEDATAADDAVDWMFELIFDYGERATGLDALPEYEPQTQAPTRLDPFSSFAFGFEVRTRWLCRQVLMFHRFEAIGPAPVLVRRLLLEYDDNEICTHLVAAHDIGYDKDDIATYAAPLEFGYSTFAPPLQEEFRPLPAMPGLNDGTRYQLVDLYGEGVPGVLYRAADLWYYREPIRGTGHADEIVYGDAQPLPGLPSRNAESPIVQTLTDLTGDARLDWMVTEPGFAGYFTLGPDRQWSGFVPFAAFPAEFGAPEGQLADLMGAGLSDFAMIGPRSVRLYANRRGEGFAAPVDVAQDSVLPGLGDGRSEVVAFCDILGSGQPHLVRVRHNAVTVWPNLGRGRFGAPRLFATLPYEYATFDAARVRFADLDGSGAADLIYLEPKHATIFMNKGGNGWATQYPLPWPEGVTYDATCEVSFADLHALGCASLIFTVPHMQPRHWHYDFAAAGKPYLLTHTDNNMGAAGEVIYRSSAQEWLDEKAEHVEHAATDSPAISGIPFPIHVVAQQRQTDQISGLQLCQHFRYRHGYYDPVERELRGFGLLLQYDAELPDAGASPEDGFTAPVLTKTWFHVGHDDWPSPLTFDASDKEAPAMGDTLRCHFDPAQDSDTPNEDWDALTRLDMARALSGAVMRVETFGLDAPDLPPFVVSESRYLVRQRQARGPLARYSVIQSLVAEQRTYQYERHPSDPRCEHTIGLRWDTHGSPLRSATVHYPRRNNAPPFAPDDEWAIRWWEDAHDDAQRQWHLTDTRHAWYDINQDDAWRVAIDWRNRADAFMLDAAELTSADIRYEDLSAADGPLDHGPRTLVSMSQIHYFSAASGAPSLAALPEFVELAELDDMALTAYGDVMSADELETALLAAGYHPMDAFLPDDPMMLWAVHRQFATFAPLTAFHRVTGYRETRSLGQTALEYDDDHCLPVSVIAPDGCTTQTSYDYRTLLPERIVDPNQVTQEARYDGFGRLQASSFHGTEQGKPAGFMPLSDYVRDIDTPDDALASPEAALQDAASAVFFDSLSWMGQIDPASASADWVTRRWILPDGHVRASARQRAPLEESDPDAMPSDVAQRLRATLRQPPHALVLQADRYPGDPARQIRRAIASSDGFGRVLQQRNFVPPGDAFQVLDDGSIAVGPDGQPVVHHAEQRWRVSERVEYNNKGLPVRVYRPYFADGHHYVRDDAFRSFGHHDRQYYDPLQRPTVTLTAAGYMRRETYWAWHTVSEDENDTAHELET